MTQILLIKPKNRFAKVIEIIEQEKHNFKFRRGNLGQDNFRCTIGLLLSHYGWTGYSCFSSNYDEADNKLHELISREEQSFIASINDYSENYDVVIERLERAGRDPLN
ncbi:MAG: hypothetical protein DLM72_11610 [Candidatus Nitrosopolaris wilkensis]|nr:MAG: hypothetical protein DLM72_11610 [Candidatus Nitrosopolaris wilkensis]